MATVSFSHLRRAKSQPTRFEFAHEELPESIVLWLRPLDDLLRDKARDIADGYIARYVTGGWRHPHTGLWMDDADAWPPIDGEPVEVSESSIRTMAVVEAMQRAPGGPDDEYPVPRLVEMAVLLPDVWREVQAAAFAARAPKASAAP